MQRLILGRRVLPAAFQTTCVSVGVVCGVLIACAVLLAAGIAAVLLAEYFMPITYSTEVRTSGGAVRGRERVSPARAVYLSFQGIPYARPPVAELRFRAPQPPEPWQGVRDALTEGNICPQPHKVHRNSPIKSMSGMLKMILSMPGMAKFMINYLSRLKEDCLYLNVYTPQTTLPAVSLKPVVVFIHGGGFVAGNGDMSLYGPDYLIEEDVVVVTINYRLGVFGFLCTNSSSAPGNVGLKDQVLALRWVRDNIRAFGGDPASVTLYGESAGAASVAYHMLSPMSRGLFHRAILSSSTTQDSYALLRHPNPERFSRSLALECGADPDTAADPERRVHFLRTLSHPAINDKLVNVLSDKDMRSIVGVVPFAPVIEADIPGEEAFLAEDPDILVREGRYAEIPVMIGSNSKEGSLFFTGVTRPPTEEGFKMIDDDMTSAIPDDIFSRLSPDKQTELAGKIRQFYFQGGHVNNESVAALVDLFGDLLLMHGIHVTSRWLAHYSLPQNPLYIYHFTVPSKTGLSFFFSTRNLKGAGHAEDLSYVFRHHLFKDEPTLKQTLREQRVRVKMTRLLGNFIRLGNPTPSRTREVDVIWPAAHSASMQYLEVGEKLVVKRDLLQERMDFWDGVYREVLQHPLYDFVKD